MPYGANSRLPAEKASKLGHLDVLKSKLVTSLCSTFEDPQLQLPTTKSSWTSVSKDKNPLPIVFGTDGSLQVITSDTRPHKTIAFVKTALVVVDQHALSRVNKAEPHPFVLRDILHQSQIYHATAFPLRHVHVPGKNVYDAVRNIIFDSF